LEQSSNMDKTGAVFQSAYLLNGFHSTVTLDEN